MNSPTLNSHDVALLIDDARSAEICCDLVLLRNLLSQVWQDDGTDPDYSCFDDEINAELLRLTGFYISQQSRSQGLIDQQIRAKDILTRSAELFTKIGSREKIAQANITLAVCYWFSGEIQECNAILSSLRNRI